MLRNPAFKVVGLPIEVITRSNVWNPSALPIVNGFLVFDERVCFLHLVSSVATPLVGLVDGVVSDEIGTSLSDVVAVFSAEIDVLGAGECTRLRR